MPDPLLQQFCNPDQYLITKAVAAVIIQYLKVINIDNQKAERGFPDSCVVDFLAEFTVKGAAVIQPGEFIGQGQAAQFAVGAVEPLSGFIQLPFPCFQHFEDFLSRNSCIT